MQEAQGGAADSADGNQAVEHGGFADRPGESPLLAQEPGHADRAGAGEHGDGQQPAADEAEREQRAGEVTGEGLERLGGLGCALDAGLVVGMQGLGCGHHDGEHDEVGERHAGEDVQAAGGLLAPGPLRALPPQGLCPGAAAGFVAHLFEAVGALPEEQVRRDSRAQHGDQEHQVGLVQLDMGDERVAQDTAPLVGDQDGHDEIGQERCAQQLECERDAGEGAQDQQGGDEGARRQRPQPGRPGVQELHAGADGDQVGGDVEAVGHDEGAQQDGEDHPAGSLEVPHGQLAETCSGRQGGAVTDLLDRGHQRQCQQGGPQERQAVLGACLGVGGDPGRVVVGRAGNQPRSHGSQVLAPDRSHVPLGEIEFRSPR